MIREETDYFTRTEARKLAHQIEAFWHSKGHRNVRAQAYPLAGFERLHGVRSNLVNGLPPQ